jgi:excisionase family DNA binding protein
MTTKSTSTAQSQSQPLTYGQAADRCCVTIRTLQRAAFAGELPVIRYGHRTVRIDPVDLSAWMNSKKSGIECPNRSEE